MKAGLTRLADLLGATGGREVVLIGGRPPIVRRSDKLSPVGGSPLSDEQVRSLAYALISAEKRRDFESGKEIEFSVELAGGRKLKGRLSNRSGRPALALKDPFRHPSLTKPPAKRHWVRLTRVCNDKCSFCLDSDAQDGTSLPLQAILSDLQKGRTLGMERVVLSGGEPTIHPEFVDIVARARAMGYTHIQTVTNGRRLCYPDFMAASVAAGLKEATFSLHGHTPALHDSQTGSPGSFLQGLLALRQGLKTPGLIVSVDVVVSKMNVAHLRDILDFFIREGVREFDLLQVIPFGAAWNNKEKLFYDVEAAVPHWRRALELSKRGDIVIWTNRLPPRFLEGFEELIQPPSKLHDEYKGRGLMFLNFLRLGMKPDCWGRCAHCFLEKPCADIEALSREGSVAPHPVPECLKDHPEVLLADQAEPRPLEHEPGLEMKKFVDFYIGHRYSLKGAACRTCRFDASCAGAPVEHVRRYGFPKPKPEMVVP